MFRDPPRDAAPGTTFSPEYTMNRFRLLTAVCALAALVGLASLNSAQAQGGKTDRANE